MSTLNGPLVTLIWAVRISPLHIDILYTDAHASGIALPSLGWPWHRRRQWEATGNREASAAPRFGFISHELQTSNCALEALSPKFKVWLAGYRRIQSG